MTNHNKKIYEESILFIEKYGEDFNSFFYRKDLDIFIRTEVLLFRDSNLNNNHFLDNSHWNQKHAFNFPGPFYTGQSDTCGTGEVEAPNNVMFDEYTMEIIFRQPQSYLDLLGVIDAAAVECFDSYSCDGNNFWTYSNCKEWWNNRYDIISEINKTKSLNRERVNIFENYLKTDGEKDLRKYCYFLENGIYPKLESATLPELE